MKVKATIYIGKPDWEYDSDYFSAASYKPSNFVVHSTQEIEIEFEPLSNQEVTQTKIATLKSQKVELKQRFHNDTCDIDDKLQKLMALTA